MIKHLFELKTFGVQISNTISFASVSERYRNIEMSQSKNGTLLLTITKRITNPINVSIKEAKSEANELVDRLVLLDNHDITDVIYLGYKNENNDLVVERKSVIVTPNLIDLIRNPSKYYNKSENKKLLNKKDNFGVLRTFRTALGIKDKLSQYLIFYGLLLVLKGESQKEVDTFIKNELKDIQIVSGKNGNETIITRIRNMIAHPKDSFDMNQLTEHVNNYLNTLKSLVLIELKKIKYQ